MISRTTLFQTLAQNARVALAKNKWGAFLNLKPQLPHIPDGSALAALPQLSQLELLQAISSLEDYAVNSRKTNDRRRSLYRLMSWRQQKLCDEAGYSKKLKRIDSYINKNQSVFSSIAETAKKKYEVSYLDFSALNKGKPSKSTSSSNYRVVESMSHFVRDWASPEETELLVNYITRQLEALILEEELSETCIVVPGSGLGRVAHEIANSREYGAVHAVEFSGLMHCCNQFIYESESDSIHTIAPYVNNTSNFLQEEAQFREVQFAGGIKKPCNLHLHLDDFCAFEIPDKQNYKNIVVISVFFIDTAENILDYFDQINQLSAPSKKSSTKNGYWINMGPLKYGSAARAELNGDEIEYIRKQMGWVDLHAESSLDSPEFADKNGLLPYITDKQSLWQGFYGVSMWSAAHRNNFKKHHY